MKLINNKSTFTILENSIKIKYMKTKNLIYIASLILIAISIVVVIEYPNSNRMELIAGMTAALGIGLNVAGFLLPKKTIPINNK